MSNPPALDALFDPAAVAVVGASPEASKPGGRCLALLQKYGYPGSVFPINPRYTSIGGVPCYPDFAALPSPIDLAILLVPAKSVAAYLRTAAQAGARAAIVCSSGFAEAGASGVELQRELVDTARNSEMAVLGPNCLGLINLDHRLVASFSTALESDQAVKTGPIAFVSQSGAMGVAVFTIAQAEGIAVGKFISTGNEAVLDFTDFVQHLTCDDSVALILGYVEGVRNGRRFVDAARRARKAGKAVALLKVGRSDAGERAAQSHTGALAGSTRIYQAAFRRAGVLPVNDIRSLLDIAVGIPAPWPARGRRVGIVSMSGGAGVMMSDACSDHGLEVTPLSAATQSALGEVLPAFAGMRNPVDYGFVYGDVEAIEMCVERVAADACIDQVLVFIGLSPGLAGIIEQRLAGVQERSAKPLIVAWLGGPRTGIERLRELGVAAYDDPSRAVAAAYYRVFFSEPVPGPEFEVAPAPSARAASTQRALRAHLDAGRALLSEREVNEVIIEYGIPVAAEVLATTSSEAAAAGARFDQLLAVKAESPDLLHKSDAGAVRLNVAPEHAADAFNAVVDAAARAVGRGKVRGALIRPMAERGIEMLAGLRYDAQFGPTITVGMGGVASEVMADAVTELVPVDLDLARSMIDRLRGAPLLRSFRGTGAHDIDALAKVLVALSGFALDAGPLLAELDLNPVIVHTEGRGCTVVDGAGVLGQVA